MIQPNELRVGNKITTHERKDLGFEAMIIECTPEFLSNFFLNIEHSYVYIPIELSREWLEKFGFEKKTLARWEKGDLSLVIGAGGMHPSIFKKICVGDEFNEELLIGNPINYVHELQNLWFALKKFELECK